MAIICYNKIMADFVLVRKSRNIASSMMHVLMNLLLGIGTVLITVMSASPILGLILVLVAKWRVLAVRPRYIFSSLKVNLIDLLVGVSVVFLSYHAGSSLLLAHFLLMGFSVVWLLFIKPLSSPKAVLAQSMIAVFMSTMAATMISTGLNAVVLTVSVFLIGYSASRHALSQGNEEDYTLTTLAAGLVSAEIAWLSHFWMIVYTFGASGIRIPQLSIILTIFAFVFNYVRQAVMKYEDRFRFKEVAPAILFGVTLIGIITLFFSKPIFNI